MGWVLTGLGVVLAIVVTAGATLALCRRYCGGWQWGARNIWSVCEEWRQKASWLWAPREEKVGLVKAQYPTAQMVPGLYLQTGNTSQYLMHSESDLKLDAQGAFTRFEAVDRDVHLPLGTGSTIPPQPLRPAPQPRPTARPRPSPINATGYIKMQETGPGPLTPPPQRYHQSEHSNESPGSSVFVFHRETAKIHNNPYKTIADQSASRYGSCATKTTPESVQMTPYTISSQSEGCKLVDFKSRHQTELEKDPVGIYVQFGTGKEPANLRYDTPDGLSYDSGQLESSADINATMSYVNSDALQKADSVLHQHDPRHARSCSQNSYETQTSSSSVAAQNIMESIYGPRAVSKMVQNGQSVGSIDKGESRGAEMCTFKNLSSVPSDAGSYVQTSPARSQELQNALQFVQDLPDGTTYNMHSDQTRGYQCQEIINDEDPALRFLDDPTVEQGSASLSSPVPPPAPLHSGTTLRKDGPTTGERIFSALKSVTSQSYIDASEFYNSVLSSAQQVQRFTFTPITRTSTMEEQNVDLNSDSGTSAQRKVDGLYGQREDKSIGIDGSRRSSDLYSPELNLEAHRTAQEVYNSLQDPPSSPLLLKDFNQEPHPYLMDPSFTRTSEDIFNSLEQRRKSMERLNGYHEFVEFDVADSPRRRGSQDLYAALEEVQMKRRLSQSLEDTYTDYTIEEIEELTPTGRHGSQGPEPEPPPNEATLKRAISCDSVCSDTSVALGDLEEAPIVGHICVGLEHERWGGRGTDGEGDLTVSVLEARDLIAPDGTPAQDTFARVCLLPDRRTHVQTRLCRSSPSPSYQEKFLFPLDGGPVGRTLLLEVFSVEISMGGGTSPLGEARLKLGPAPRPPATTWLPLVGPALPTPHLGELMFSLSYLPTAERLTLVVVKARNLRGANPLPGDFFVKIYLLQQGKKVHKKKTSVKKGEKSPIFNEAIIFSVPTHALQTIQLRLTVAETTGDQGTSSKANSVGHVIVGSSASGRALSHWRQMLTALRRPVAMWHPLRK